MNLPLILDLTIGLIVIYLFLSIISSEIQELLTTLLQWRAAHLKHSIENILLGSESKEQEQKIKNIVQELYENPLIKNISQESKTGIEAWLRTTMRTIITLGKRKIFLKGNEPSYIPSETFATTLIERLNILNLSQKLTALNLKKTIKEDLLEKIEIYLNNSNLSIKEENREKLKEEFQTTKDKINEIYGDFDAGKATILICLNRIGYEFKNYIEISKSLLPKTSSNSQEENLTQNNISHTDPGVEKFISQLESLRDNIFYQGRPDNINSSNIDELIRRLQPNLEQLLELAARVGRTYETFQAQQKILAENDEINQDFQAIEKEIKAIEDKLPPSVRQSLASLAKRAQVNLKSTQTQVQVVEEEIYQFKKEIEVWFDRSMERASGVYKRNAKGVAFIIGLIIAVSINADTFYIVNRLMTDSTLRNTLTANATLVIENCQSTVENVATNSNKQKAAPLDCIRQEIDDAIPLPLGWTEMNWKQQLDLDLENNGQQQLTRLWLPLRMILGWVITAFALMMGASFWFDLLGKVINVRNSGKPPKSSAAQENVN